MKPHVLDQQFLSFLDFHADSVECVTFRHGTTGARFKVLHCKACDAQIELPGDLAAVPYTRWRLAEDFEYVH